MRTTVNLDDDVVLAVRERARRDHRSIGAVLSELARAALTQHHDLGGGCARHGFEPFPSRGRAVSNELIDLLREDEPG